MWLSLVEQTGLNISSEAIFALYVGSIDDRDRY